MSLNVKDLRAHEKNLLNIMEHAEKELEAVRMLISGLELRHSTASSKSSQLGKSMGRVVEEITKDYNEWLTATEVTNLVSKVAPEKRSKHLRVNVGVALKVLYDKGKLDRKNVGDAVVPKYAYKQRDNN